MTSCACVSLSFCREVSVSPSSMQAKSLHERVDGVEEELHATSGRLEASLATCERLQEDVEKISNENREMEEELETIR